MCLEMCIRDRSMGVNLRWGGDWDQDFEVQDNKFDDFPHFEIRD